MKTEKWTEDLRKYLVDEVRDSAEYYINSQKPEAIECVERNLRILSLLEDVFYESEESNVNQNGLPSGWKLRDLIEWNKKKDYTI